MRVLAQKIKGIDWGQRCHQIFKNSVLNGWKSENPHSRRPLTEKSRQNKIRLWILSTITSFWFTSNKKNLKKKKKHKHNERKTMISLFGCTLSTSQRLWNQTRTVAKEGNLPLKKMIHGFQAKQLMSQQCTASVFGGVSLAWTGNKSPSIPRMKRGSQVSQSKHGDSAACRSGWNMTRFPLGYSSSSWGKDGNSHHDLIGFPACDASAGLSNCC